MICVLYQLNNFKCFRLFIFLFAIIIIMILMNKQFTGVIWSIVAHGYHCQTRWIPHSSMLSCVLIACAQPAIRFVLALLIKLSIIIQYHISQMLHRIIFRQQFLSFFIYSISQPIHIAYITMFLAGFELHTSKCHLVNQNQVCHPWTKNICHCLELSHLML